MPVRVYDRSGSRMSKKRLYIAVGAVLFITSIAQAWERSVYAIFPLIASIALWRYARRLK
ncbi:hypothetical protein PA598K_03810 [Paenibacillus sp. 598K]|nr:hypothetical protein PA598K_03810 [Paenibacillus sp. 598K]